jgi:hypothetical protein
MHTDPELLSLLALGEQVGTDVDRAHVRACPDCAGELSELQRLVGLVRSVDAETTMTAPHPRVWARIRDELELDPTMDPHVDRSPSLPPLRSLLEMITTALAGPSREPAAALVAHAALAPGGPDWSDAAGEAVLATDQLGRRILQVALDAELPSSGVRQAWLVHRDTPTLRQTLGILDGPYGVWTVDQSIDLEQYTIFDISQQDAGENEHSGQTIVRGQFTLVS